MKRIRSSSPGFTLTVTVAGVNVPSTVVKYSSEYWTPLWISTVAGIRSSSKKEGGTGYDIEMSCENYVEFRSLKNYHVTVKSPSISSAIDILEVKLHHQNQICFKVIIIIIS